MIRHETPGDVCRIHDLDCAAFNGPGEAALVDALRATAPVFISLVAEVGVRGRWPMFPGSCAIQMPSHRSRRVGETIDTSKHRPTPTPGNGRHRLTAGRSSRLLISGAGR